MIGSRNNDFFDPWSNCIEVVGYKDIHFSKTATLIDGMGVGDLEKTVAAKRELSEKRLG
jgi:hypothetical protein